jgi:uncharacterized repeat protein (TIGR01451 family)
LACTLVVRNTGAAAVASVRVEVPLPPGLRLLFSEPAADARGDRLAWDLGTLEAGAERRLPFELQADGPGEVLWNPTVTFTAADGPRTRVVRPPFALTVTGPEAAYVGGKVAFEIRVANHGEAAVPNVVVRDQLPPGLQHPEGGLIEAELGTLAAGAVRTLTLETTAARTGRLVNEVSARADGGLQARSRAAVLVREAALALRLEGPRQGLVNRELDFLLEVANPGSAPAAGLRLALTLPDGLDFLAASTGGTFDPSGRQVTWAPGTLAGGQRQTVTAKLRARRAGDWALRALARADQMAPAPATAAVHLDGVADLSLEWRAHDDPVDVGAETTFELCVLNQGSEPGVGVRLVAAVPDGLLPTQADGPTAVHIQQQQVVFEPLPQLAPRADAVYHIRVRGTHPGAGRFRVELTAASLRHPVLAEVDTHVRLGRSAAAGGSP